MTSITHTPGPWHVHHRWPGYTGIEIRAGETNIADLRINGHNEIHGEANARVMAAAPELLAALEAQERVEHDPEAARRTGYFDHAGRLRQAAIAKARGQA